ncbi:MAG TPA: FAD-dependent oxidoreductase [Nocardioides sp.]
MTKLEFDVVCVGTGVGGCAAAAAAAEAGARVLLVEKMAQVGGVTAYSGGQTWVPGSRQQADLGIEDSVAEGAAYLQELAGGWGDPERTVGLLAAAKDAVDYFESVHGIGMQVIKELPDYYYPLLEHAAADGRYLEPVGIDTALLGEWAPRLRRSPIGSSGGGLGRDGAEGSVGGEHVFMGEALAAHYVHAALAAGVELWASSPARRLVVEDGVVRGIVVHHDGEDVEIAVTGGVVLATGGYDWNPDLVRRFEGALDDHGSAAPAGIEGDHLVMAAPTGAAISTLPAARNVMQVGFPQGIEDEDGHDLHSSYRAVNPHEIIVNATGRRFANESFYPAMSAALQTLDGATHTMPNWPCWLVFDQDYVEGDAARAPRLDLAVKADTIRELAELAGIDPDGLEEQVARYNEHCAAGADSDFQRGEQIWSIAMFRDRPALDAGNPTLGPIARGPFYAARMSRVQFGVASAGLQVDGDARVLTYTGEAVLGLYAAGNSAGRNDVGAGLQSGVANMRGLAYGYLAGRHVAARAAEQAE